MTIIGLIIAMGSLLGGFVAMGGHVMVIWQPWEYVIIGGSALGTFIIANPIKVVRDTGTDRPLDAAGITINRLPMLHVVFDEPDGDHEARARKGHRREGPGRDRGPARNAEGHRLGPRQGGAEALPRLHVRLKATGGRLRLPPFTKP